MWKKKDDNRESLSKKGLTLYTNECFIQSYFQYIFNVSSIKDYFVVKCYIVF